MVIAPELIELVPFLFLWQAYDPKVKADLVSTAIVTADGIYLVDPILLEENALNELLRKGCMAGIIVTNENHLRAAPTFAARFCVPIYSRAKLLADETHGFVDASDAQEISEMQVIRIDGAVAGEIVLYHSLHGGTLICGDALINFQPHGFALLPAKYCSDKKVMQRSLQNLLNLKVGRMLFAHGTPILSGAGERLAALLGSH